MRKLLATLAFIATPAYAIDPLTAPENVRVDTVDEQVCVSVRNELRNHVRSIYGTERAWDTLWYENSRGEYLAFDCYHIGYTTRPYTVQYYSVIYVTTKEAVKAQARSEREALKRNLEEKRNAVRNSGYY